MALERTKPDSEASDEKLLARYRHGEEQVFELLVERYRLELFHFLFRFVGNRGAAAEDLFQEAFLQVHLSADTFDPERRFRPWLFTIAANKARDFLRRNSKRQASTLSAPLGGDGEDQRSLADLLPGDGLIPMEEAAQQETRELVQKVIAEMPEHLREVLLMAYFHQFAYKEIAEMLKVPLGTVKSRLHAAVASFAELRKNRYGELRGE